MYNAFILNLSSSIPHPKSEYMANTEHSLPSSKQYQRIGMIARWQPVHLGHAPVLRALCENAVHALVGIGSADTRDYRSPFTLEETTAMLEIALADHQNYTLIPVPDLHDGPRWRELVLELFGDLDVFVTANPYVRSLLESDYPILHPVELVPPDQRVPVEGMAVRRAMARGEDWQALVPPQIAAYLTENHLAKRFQREFGLQTLALETMLE